MRPILIISHNTRSAGTLNITKNLLNYLADQKIPIIFTLPANADISVNSKNKNLKIIRCNNHLPGIGLINRVIFDIFIIPLIILQNRPKLIIGLANYYVNFFKTPSKLIIRQPYLLENHNKQFLNKKEKVIEYLRNVYFEQSIKTSSHIFLQSGYMYELFIQKFPKYKNISSVLSNPISPFFEKAEYKSKDNDEFLIVYPSRYYPHKNHQFIINLAEKYRDYFKANNIRFLLTISEAQKSSKFLMKLVKEKALFSIVQNLGEIPQSELLHVYEKSKAIIFPSLAETFGNGLIEGLYLKLPVIIPDLPYAKTVLGEAGVYYENNNLESAFYRIKQLVKEKAYYDGIVKLSKIQSLLYPNVEFWWHKLSN